MGLRAWLGCLGTVLGLFTMTHFASCTALECEKHPISWIPGGAQKLVPVDVDLDGGIDILSSGKGSRCRENDGTGEFVEHEVVPDIGTVISIKVESIVG